MPPGPRCVLRTSSFDHPASCVPDVVAARPFLHSVTLVVPAGADADAADPPVRRLPAPPPHFAATAPLTSLVSPSFIEWAVPVRGQPSAVALTTPASPCAASPAWPPPQARRTRWTPSCASAAWCWAASPSRGRRTWC